MHPRQPLPPALIVRAGKQNGVLSRAQLAHAGVSDRQILRMLDQQLLTRLDRAVYLLGVRTPTWDQYAWAAHLLGGKDSRLLGRSAGAAFGLCAEVLPIHLGVPLASGLGSRVWLRVTRESPTGRLGARQGSPPRTLIDDTVVDLCAEADSDADVIGYLTTASQRLTDYRRLEAALDRRTRIAHRRLISDIVGEVKAGVRSPLEHRWVTKVERPHRLPPATRPYPLASGVIADGAWEEPRVLLELDGRRYHDGERVFRDWRRDNAASEDDWLTVRYGWHDTAIEPCATAGNIGRILQRRGWAGSLQRCPRCS